MDKVAVKPTENVIWKATKRLVSFLLYWVFQLSHLLYSRILFRGCIYTTLPIYTYIFYASSYKESVIRHLIFYLSLFSLARITHEVMQALFVFEWSRKKIRLHFIARAVWRFMGPLKINNGAPLNEILQIIK